MQTAIDLRGLSTLQVEELTESMPGEPPAGTVIIIASRGPESITIALPREVALSLHQGLDPWARAIREEQDNGPKPSTN